MQSVFLLLLLPAVSALIAIKSKLILKHQADFCDPRLCERSEHHVACNHDKFSSFCPQNARLIEFSDAEKKLILLQHNSLRNKVASGQHELYRPARRMASMQWHETLAYVSTFNLKSCRFKHDDCRNTRN